jgi:hypothetical protein
MFKIFFTLFFLLISYETFGMFEFDVLTERMCDRLCKGDNITSRDLAEWIDTATPDHLCYVNEEYEFDKLDDIEKDELFDALCTVVSFDIPTSDGKNNFERSIRELKDKKYSCLFVIFNHMPRTLLLNE